MRNLLLAGAAGLFLAIGAANAYAVPQNSPYATLVPPNAVDGYDSGSGPVYGGQDYGYESEPTVQERSAYVDPEYGYGDPAYASNYEYPAPRGGSFYGMGRGRYHEHDVGGLGRWTFHR